jgi:hypothetical protein
MGPPELCEEGSRRLATTREGLVGAASFRT